MKIFAPILLLLLAFGSCKKPDSFEYRDLRNFKLYSLCFENSSVSMDLIYFNPNNFGVDLNIIDCDVYVDHNYLGKYRLDTTMHIAKRSEFVVPSKMVLNMKNLFKNNLTSYFAIELLLEDNGNKRLCNAVIYITVPCSYTGRQEFSMF